MESVLHIEMMDRHIPAPMTIGHTEYVCYGEKTIGIDVEGDEMHTPANTIRLGFPLEAFEGSSRTHVPLIKTLEYMPDYTRRKGHIYLETVHYLKDYKYLIPVRTKIHSGPDQGARYTHLRSMAFSRESLCGPSIDIRSAKSEIVNDLYYHDKYFIDNSTKPIVDWTRVELVYELERNKVADICFNGEEIIKVVDRFCNEVSKTPHDIGKHHLDEVRRIINSPYVQLPSDYYSNDVVARSLGKVRDNLMVLGDFKGFGKLVLDNIPRVEHNPFTFSGILSKIDNTMLTDINVDVLVDVDGSIPHVHTHVAHNRLAVFSDNELSAFSPDTLLSTLVNEMTMREILKLFSDTHIHVDDVTRFIINTEMVKIKIIKTMGDEALILLYRGNSHSRDEPLAGVYFDIALYSLAPLTIIPGTNCF